MDTAELLELYKSVLEEYRFQVRFNWDRLRYSLTLSIGLTSIGFGLIRFGEDNPSVLVASIFAFGASIAMAWLGIKITEKGHQYYREVINQKARIEKALKLHATQVGDQSFDLALETTEGMKHQGRVLRKSAYMDQELITKGTIVHRFIQGFRILMGISTFGAIVSASMLVP